MKKFAFLIAAVFYSAGAMAETPPAMAPGDPARFAAAKEKIVERIQSHIKVLDNTLACVKKAQEPAALRLCKEQQTTQLRAMAPADRRR